MLLTVRADIFMFFVPLFLLTSTWIMFTHNFQLGICCVFFKFLIPELLIKNDCSRAVCRGWCILFYGGIRSLKHRTFVSQISLNQWKSSTANLLYFSVMYILTENTNKWNSDRAHQPPLYCLLQPFLLPSFMACWRYSESLSWLLRCY